MTPPNRRNFLRTSAAVAAASLAVHNSMAMSPSAPAVVAPGPERYVEDLALEALNAARQAHEKSQTAAEAGAGYALPASLGEWTLFNKVFFERAFTAWYRELDKR